MQTVNYKYVGIIPPNILLKLTKIQAGLEKPTADTLGSHFSNFSNFYILVFCWKNAF